MDRLMSSLLMRTGYVPISAESIETGKAETEKLPPGANANGEIISESDITFNVNDPEFDDSLDLL